MMQSALTLNEQVKYKNACTVFRFGTCEFIEVTEY